VNENLEELQAYQRELGRLSTLLQSAIDEEETALEVEEAEAERAAA